MPLPELPKKSLGQHWLTDTATLDLIASYAELKASDTVLEIGPGLGTLTEVLVAMVKKVVAVEIDKDLSDQLKAKLDSSKLEVVTDNILKYDLGQLPNNYKVVANIPYYLTSNLLRILSEASNYPTVVVLLIQKEVAKRIHAEPGNMSILSVTTQLYWQVSIKNIIPAVMFYPSPKVDSQVVALKRRAKPLFDDIEDIKFIRLVKWGFAARRKTLLNSLSGGMRLEKDELEGLLKQASINPSSRPQTLSLSQWHDIYQVFVAQSVL